MNESPPLKSEPPVKTLPEDSDYPLLSKLKESVLLKQEGKPFPLVNVSEVRIADMQLLFLHEQTASGIRTTLLDFPLQLEGAEECHE